MEVADITGIILTKLDGTAKGGIAVAIHSELGIPVNDLWSVVQPEIGTLLCDDLIHPSAVGREVLGRAVAQAIRQQLEND